MPDFIVRVRHAYSSPPQPEIDEAGGRGCVVLQVSVAESAEGMAAGRCTPTLRVLPIHFLRIGCSQRRRTFDWLSSLPVRERNNNPDFLSPMNSRSIVATEECRSISRLLSSVFKNSWTLPCYIFWLILMVVEQSGEMYLRSIPRHSPNRNPPAPQRMKNIVTHFFFGGTGPPTIPVTTLPVKMGGSGFFTCSASIHLWFHGWG